MRWQNHSREQLSHIRSKQALSWARGKESYEEEKGKKLSKIINDNLDWVNRTANSILWDQWALLKNKISEKGSLIIDEEVKNAFQNAGEMLGYHQDNPVSIMMQEIWDNYLSGNESAPIWLIMLYEFIKYDAEKWKYGGWKMRDSVVSDWLEYISKSLPGLLIIYPQIIWRLFWKSLEDDMKGFLSESQMIIDKEMEDNVLGWLIRVDEEIREEYTRRDLGYKEKVQNHQEIIMEISDWNMGAISVIKEIISLTDGEELWQILNYLSTNNIKWPKLWDLFKRDNDEDIDKLMKYLQNQM